MVVLKETELRGAVDMHLMPQWKVVRIKEEGERRGAGQGSYRFGEDGEVKKGQELSVQGVVIVRFWQIDVANVRLWLGR